MAFTKGNNANPAGRPKGSKNKATAEIKAMIETALTNVGGVAYLERQAVENPVAFMGLLGKILPKDVTLDVKRDLLVRVIDHTGAGPVMQDREE